MMRCQRVFRYLTIFAALPMLWGAPVMAQTITEIHELSFGTFAVRDNDSMAAIIVTPDNDTFADPQIAMAADGQRAEYVLSGLPPNVSFFLGVDVPVPPSEGGLIIDMPTPATGSSGPAFELSDLTIADGGVMQSDGAGDATLYIGGTLRTSGTGQSYDGGNYNGQYGITIYY